jgi:hypothetical protein
VGTSHVLNWIIKLQIIWRLERSVNSEASPLSSTIGGIPSGIGILSRGMASFGGYFDYLKYRQEIP